jgi:branched-chain amino acid transport system substrate-binding protein
MNPLSCALVKWTSLIFLSFSPLYAQPQSVAKTNGIYTDRIVFGQSAKLSGAGIAQTGAQYRDGMLLAFSAANQDGGVHGRQIELISLNDDVNPKKAVANTKELIEKHRVFALIGSTFTEPVKAVLPILRENHISLIAPYTGFPELYDGSIREVFTLRASFDDELAALIQHIDTVNYDNVGLAYYGNSLGEEFKRDVSKRLSQVGRELIASATMPLNSPDPTKAAQPAAEALAPKCPKVVILGVSSNDAVALVKAIKNNGCPSPRYLARGLVNISVLMKGLGEDARGIIVTQVVPNPFRNSTHPLIQTYKRLLQQRDAKGSPTFPEFEGFVAGQFAVQALRRAGQELNRQSFVRAMESERLEGPGHFRVQFGGGKRVGTNYVNIVMISDNNRISD